MRQFDSFASTLNFLSRTSWRAPDLPFVKSLVSSVAGSTVGRPFLCNDLLHVLFRLRRIRSSKVVIKEAYGAGNEMDWPISLDALYEVLVRVDGVTLATAACASSVFHRVSGDKKIWESVCNLQWPSTNDPEVRSIISAVGGFQKFYGECFPLIVNKQSVVFDQAYAFLKDAESWFDEEDDMIDELSGTSTDDFVSIVDLVFRGRSIEYKVLHGIPGADDFHGWFSNCPFRIDIISFTEEDEDQASSNSVVISEGLPSVTSIEKERKDGRLWKALWDDIRVSWILVNRKTKQMANLASWRPIGGQRHWPSDKDFLVRFGSILPAGRLFSGKVVQCNIVLKCRLINTCAEEDFKSFLKITELSMQLEDMAGTHLNGRHSLLVLKESLTCKKSMNHHDVLKSYLQYLRAQSELKEEKLRSEGRVDTVCIICGILSFVALFYFAF